MNSRRDAPRPFSIWLLPEPTLASEFRTEIARLATVTRTAEFEPHATLLGDLTGEPQHVRQACLPALGGIGALHVTVRDVVSTERFFMSLFLDLEVSAQLHRFRTELAKKLEVETQLPFRPHVSLAYGLDLTASSGMIMEALKVKFKGRAFRLTHCAIVDSSSETPIGSWQIISQFELA